ncbi:MAG: cation:proton antiporter [Methanomicrobiales archaeon]|nr:cation:proton antiporter [Methanomicrobiales archaeon]
MNIELWDVALLLLAAKIGGTLLTKLRQPALIGELLAGTLVGSILVGFGDSSTIQVVAQLGIIFLILLTMLSIDLREIEQEIDRLVLVQVASAAIIFILLLGIFSLLNLGFDLVLVAGAAIFGSSTAISAKTLLSMNELSSREGQAIIGLQIVNGIIELLLISAATNIIQYQRFDIEPILSLTLMIIGTYVVMSGIGSKFITWLVNSVQVLKMEEVLLALTLLLAFSTAAITESVGMTSFFGVMLIGVLLSRTEQSRRISKTIEQLGESFFIPVFFASLGLSVHLLAVLDNLSLLLLLTAVLTMVRFAAYLIPLGFCNYSLAESLKISAGLLPMSEYGLLMLGIGITYNVLDSTIYSILIVIFLVMNILAPILIGLVFGSGPSRKTARRQRWDRYSI